MFKSEEKVRNFLGNVSERLCSGGYFVCTHPDANVIVKKLRERNEMDSEGRFFSENKYYSLISDTLNFPKEKGAYGHPYGFFLADGLVGSKFENEDGKTFMEYVPEYLIVFKELVKLAKEYGLELIESKNFHDFYSENIQNSKYHFIFKNKIGFDLVGKSTLLMEPELWDVSYLYRVAAFKKVTGTEMQELDRSIFKPTKYFKVNRKKKFGAKKFVSKKKREAMKKEEEMKASS